ncbi:lipoprotein [Salmonella enterica subsp. enterica serovar Choleraesuis]|nr:lipoprotein [Salmonella enterica subsp. enterica serovar Choleraesuis]
MISFTSFAADIITDKSGENIPSDLHYTAQPSESSPTQQQRPPAFWHTDVLPIWGKEARAQGYDLPEPFGININYMNIRQNIDVESIKFKNLNALGLFPISSDLFNIDVAKTRQKSKTRTIKLDAWILPFWNVYGIVGKTRGHSLSKVSVDSDPANYSGMDKIIAGVIHGMNESGKLRDLDFKLNFKGNTYGAGTVLTGGYKNWFGLIDFNYTQTRFDILDGSIDAFTLSPRVGYSFQTPSVGSIYLPAGKLNVWVGTMYQNVQQEFKGSLRDLNMPAELQSLMTLANKKGQGRFDVKQHLESPWNMLVGAQYEITRNFAVMTEVGFAKRNSLLVSGEFRF